MSTATLIKTAKILVDAASKSDTLNSTLIHNLTEIDGQLSDAQDRPCDNEEFLQIFEAREEISAVLRRETSTFSFA